MQIAVSDAKARLTDLIRRAEAGDEVVLTRHGRACVRLTPIQQQVDREAVRRRRLAAVDRALAAAAERGRDGQLPAARAADYLYDERGLPA